LCYNLNFFVWNWNWDSSNHWNSLNNWCWYWNWCSDWNSSNNWILNMMNIISLNNSLYDWLSNELLCWLLKSLKSCSYDSLSWFNNWFLFNSFITLSIDFNINIFSLNNWLNISLIISSCTRSCDVFSSCSFLINWFFYNRFIIKYFLFLWNKSNFFSIINNSSIINWLS